MTKRKKRLFRRYQFPHIQFVSMLLLIILIIFLVIISISLQNKTPQTLYTKAEGPTCHKFCQTEPACCTQIIKRYKELGGTPDDIADLPDSEQPYHECPGLYDGENERGYCRPETCNQLPEGLKYRGRCGWYWSYHEGATDTANGYGCMIGPADNMRPICSTGTKPTVTPKPNPTTTSPSNPTVTPGSVNCPTISSESYDSWGLNPPDLTANTNPDTNVFLRGYAETDGELKLITYGYPAGEPPDPDAPQLNSILGNGPQFLHLYKIHKWDWANKKPSSEYETYAPVSVLGLYAKPGQILHTPSSGAKYTIGAGYKAMLIYADEKSVAINWTGDDDATVGYAAHINGICVDTNLVALYKQLNNEGRRKMPVLKDGQKIGTAKTNEVKIAIRDSGTFHDPRSRLDWWKNVKDVTPVPTSSNNPTPTSGIIPTQPAGTAGANSVLVQVIDRTDPNKPHLFTDESSCISSYTNLSNHLSVYITGPTKEQSEFGELLLIQGKNNCTCKSAGGFPYTCYPGAVIWKGANGTSGTAAGNYTAQIQTLPQGWEKITDRASGTLSSGSSLMLNLSIRHKGSSNNVPTVTGSLPSPTSQVSPTVFLSGYTNQDYQNLISKYTQENISAIDVSSWIIKATRVPGLQTSVCYPPNCVFK